MGFGAGVGVGVGAGIIVRQYRTLIGERRNVRDRQDKKTLCPKAVPARFCLDNRPEQIYAFDKDNPQAGVVVRSIENVEVSRDAYSVANDAVLKQREDKWAEILKTLKGQSVSELNELISDRERSVTLRAWLARFVVDSKQRSRGFRERMSEPANAIRLQLRSKLETLETDLLTRFSDLRDELQIIFPRFRELAGIDSDRKFEALHLSPFLRGEEGEKRYRWYEEGSWRFDEALDSRTFITSDIPSNSLLLGPEPEYRNWMWFDMPLTAELHLMGMCGDARAEGGLAPRMVKMSDREMDLANMCVFQSAERFVYGSSEDEILRASEQSAE